MVTNFRQNRRSVIIIALLLLIGTGLRAQSGGISSADRFVTQSWALQFGVSSNLTLSSFQGALFSVQHHFNSGNAIRIGMEGSLSHSSSEESFASAYSIDGTSASTDRQSVTLTTQYIHYLNPGAEILAYWGTGPLIGYSHLQSTSRNVNGAYVNTGSIRGHSWIGGMQALLGTEWFFANALSLHAEYGLSIRYTWNTSTYSSSSESIDTYSSTMRHTTNSGWSLSGNNVHLGLSVYF
jgi:hypothetical protein